MTTIYKGHDLEDFRSFGFSSESEYKRSIDKKTYKKSTALTEKGKATTAIQKDQGLPALTGSTKQKDWALSLRADFIKAFPDQLKLVANNAKAKKAKFWIDNRAGITKSHFEKELEKIPVWRKSSEKFQQLTFS